MATEAPEFRVVAANEAGRTCPYCRFPFKQGAQACECGSCHSMHHAECWDDNHGCAVLGCASGPSKEAQSAPASPPTVTINHAPPQNAAPARPAVTAATAAEFASQLRSGLSTPVVTAAALAALRALGLIAAVALAVALLTPDTSVLGVAGADAGLLKETVRDIVASTQARYGFRHYTYPLLPLLFVFVPVAASFWGVRTEAHRTAGLAPRMRLLSAVGAGLALAIALLIVATFGKGDGASFSSGSVILLGTFCGATGGLIAMGRVLRANGDDPLAEVPAGIRGRLPLLGVALKPLAVLLAAMAVIGVGGWIVQTTRHKEIASFERHRGTALVEAPFSAANFAIQGTALSAFAKLHGAIGEDSYLAFATPLPPEPTTSAERFFRNYRLSAYSHNYSGVLFVPILIVMLGSLLACAVFAGFAVARAASPAEPRGAAAWGAGVGPVWALSIVLLRALGNVTSVDAGSAFISLLLICGAAGASGGLMSLRSSRA